mmetsp:Transcript_11694/g.50024  ORF Transcript_11694/g.50024 Transcript_11694/m.50024 type:complete len:438 (-) Transcript_11694:3215-4528(-)
MPLVPDRAEELGELQHRRVREHHRQDNLAPELHRAVVHAVPVLVAPVRVPPDVHVGQLVRHVDHARAGEVEHHHHVRELLQVGVVRHRLRGDRPGHGVEVQALLQVLQHVAQVVARRRDVQKHGEPIGVPRHFAVEKAVRRANRVGVDVGVHRSQLPGVSRGVVVIRDEILQFDVVQRPLPLAALRSAEHRVHPERIRRELIGAALRADVHEATAAIHQLVPRLVNEQAADQAVRVSDVPTADVRTWRGVLRGGTALENAVPIPVRDGRLRAEVARAARAAGGLQQRTAPAARRSEVLLRRRDALALREQRLCGGGEKSVRGDIRGVIARFVRIQEPAPRGWRQRRGRRRRRRGGRRWRRRRRRVGRRRPELRVRRRVEENLRRAESRAVLARLAQPVLARAERVDRRLEGVRLLLQQNLEFRHGLQNLLLHGDGRV